MINLKIKIELSDVLQKYVLMSRYDKKKLILFKKKFIKKILKNKELILNLLHEFTGLNWKRNQINVWLFDGYYNSIPSPLLLNVYDYDINYSLFEFIHLLVHNLFQDNDLYNYFKEDEWINETELEAYTYLITKKISEELFKKSEFKKVLKKAECKGFKKYIWDKVMILENQINIKSKPIKSVLIKH